MIARVGDLFAGLTGRGLLALGLFVAALVAAPLFVDGYALSVLTIVLWFAYVGQAWNIMMGYAGQLSLGHALYVGIGAYAAAALYVHFGIGPWLGLWVGAAIAALAGCAIAFLGFRFRVRGVYFALLTIAFAEFTRILVDHVGWLGASGGLFLPVEQRASDDLLNLRGTPQMFYFVALALTLGGLVLCRLLVGSRLGYEWQALREDIDAAQALGVDVFRAKTLAVVISAAMTAVGGVFFAFFYNNLFPESVFAQSRSIEIILAPIVGGIGTLFGPVFGAFVLTPLGEAITNLLESLGLAAPGVKQILYGVALIAIIVLRPQGLWPWIADRLRLVRKPGREGQPP